MQTVVSLSTDEKIIGVFLMEAVLLANYLAKQIVRLTAGHSHVAVFIMHVPLHPRLFYFWLNHRLFSYSEMIFKT